MSSRKDPKRKRGEGSENSKANDGTSLQNEETGDEAQMMINAAPLVLRFYSLFSCDQLVSLELSLMSLL